MSTDEKFMSGRFQSLKRKVTDRYNFTWMWLHPTGLVFPRPIFLVQQSVSFYYMESLKVSFKAEFLLHLLLFGEKVKSYFYIVQSINSQGLKMVAYSWTKSLRILGFMYYLYAKNSHKTPRIHKQFYIKSH